MEHDHNIEVSNELPDNTVIWKYYSLEKFFSLILKSELHFTQILKLIDDFEGSRPKEYGEFLYTAKVPGGLSNRFKKQRETQEQNLLKLVQVPKDALEVLVNCWTKHKTESYALWRIYTDIYSGIAIKSTIGHLKSAIISNEHFLYVYPINYKPNKDKRFELATIVTRKKGFYEFENEVRLFIKSDSKSVQVRIDTNKLISEIYLSPLMPDYTKDVVKEFLSVKGIKLIDKIRVSSIKLRNI